MSPNTIRGSLDDVAQSQQLRMPILQDLACPTVYLSLIDDAEQGQNFARLQEEGEEKRARFEGRNNFTQDPHRRGTMSDDDRKLLHEILENYESQWKEVEKMIEWRGPGSLILSHTDDILMPHDVRVSLQLIGLLRSNLVQKPNLEEAFFLALKLNRGTGFDTPGSTKYDSRNKQNKWSKDVQARCKTLEGVNIEKTTDGGHPPQTQASDNLSALGTETQEERLAWCPVLQDFIPPKHGVTAHIVAHSWGPELIQKIFQDRENGKDIIWNVRNGLWMAKAVEKAFDNARVVLVPEDTENPDFDVDDYAIKLVVLDKKLLEKGQGMILSWKPKSGPKREVYWHEVDGRTLRFPEGAGRPAKRFLFFNYLHATLRLSTRQPSGWEYGMDQLHNMGSSWATPGSYLTQGILPNFKDKAKQALVPFDLDDSDQSEELLSENGNLSLGYEGFEGVQIAQNMLTCYELDQESGYGSLMSLSSLSEQRSHGSQGIFEMDQDWN